MPVFLLLLKWLWASPNTALGLLAALLARLSGGSVQRRDGALEVSGRAIAWMLQHLIPLRGGALAVTLGHVIVGRSEQALRRHSAHERVHVRQYERWGPLFIPAYLLASLALILTGRDPYLDNPFEREARRKGDPIDRAAALRRT